MNAIPDDFLAWAQDPARSVEERYCLVRLTEYCYSYHYHGADKAYPNFEHERQMREDRCYNAAYDPVPDPALLPFVAKVLPTLTKLELDTSYTDRPIRDLSVLAFMPSLQEIKLKDIEIERLEALRHTPLLQKFHIRTNNVDDYSDLALCRELREITIQTWHPWPIVDSLQDLPHLERLEWLCNGRSLAGISTLPHLKELVIDWPGHHSELSNCVKDFHQLPSMPQLETLWGGWFYRLDGIGRYPKLRLACVKGYFKCLKPLAELKEISHLRVVSPRIQDIAIIAEMPSVFQFAIQSIHPQDWTTLFDSISLREIYQDGCDAPQPDYHTLRMLLPPLDELFGSEKPRPHLPLRLRLWTKEQPYNCSFPDGPDGWDGFLPMRQSEIHWSHEELRLALKKGGFLKHEGVRFEKEQRSSYSMFYTQPRSHTTRRAKIRLLRMDAIGRLRGIIECMRTVLLRTRYPWQIHFTLSPEADADDYDRPWRNKSTAQERIEDLLQEERDAERAQQRRRLFLKDQQRLRVLKELGQDTAEFRPSQLPPEEKLPEVIIRTPGQDKEPKKPKDMDDDANNGGLAEADPHQEEEQESWLPPVEIGDPNEDWNRFFMMFTLTEDGVWLNEERTEAIDALAYLLDIVPEYPEGYETESEDEEQ